MLLPSVCTGIRTLLCLWSLLLRGEVGVRALRLLTGHTKGDLQHSILLVCVRPFSGKLSVWFSLPAACESHLWRSEVQTLQPKTLNGLLMNASPHGLAQLYLSCQGDPNVLLGVRNSVSKG